MSLRTSALVSSSIAVACFVLLQVLTWISTAQLPWAEEPGGYHNPRYDVDVLLPDKHHLVLPPEDDLVGFQRPRGQIATCTRHAPHLQPNTDRLAAQPLYSES